MKHKKKLANKDIREYARRYNVSLAEIATELNLSENEFKQRLKTELCPAAKAKIIKIISTEEIEEQSLIFAVARINERTKKGLPCGRWRLERVV